MCVASQPASRQAAATYVCVYPAALPFPRIHTPCIHACIEARVTSEIVVVMALLPLFPLLSPCKNAQRKGTDLISGWEQQRGREGGGLTPTVQLSMQEGAKGTSERQEREREKRTNFRLMKMKAAPVELRAPIKSKN